ncbi:MAG: PaaI family thioesterase [Polyangiaceae bacterium]
MVLDLANAGPARTVRLYRPAQPQTTVADMSELADARGPLKKQPSSALCFVCGTENERGLGAIFVDDGREVFADVTPREHHQGWPGVLHGGVLSAILDETIGRVAFLYDRWVQTARLTVRFVKPAPLDRALRARGWLVRDQRRLMTMAGEIVLVETGEVLASAEGAFVPLGDEARNALAAQLGGDFASWESWLRGRPL